MKKLLTIAVLLLQAVCLSAQKPLVEPFKENYITTGFPLNAAPRWDTNDLTFQISERFNLDRRSDRWDCFVGYTQMAVWDVYKPSNPFRSNTYSYGLYAERQWPERGGDLMFGYEHRSNGYDSDESRTLNHLLLVWTKTFTPWLSAQMSGRIGMGGIGNDVSFRMYEQYEGFFDLSVALHTRDRRFVASATVTPLFSSDIPANVTAELAFRPTRACDWFYLTVRYHYGYNENQLDCAVPDVFLKQMLRFGLSFQPSRLAHKLYW